MEKSERLDSVRTLFSLEDGMVGQTIFLTGGTGMMGSAFLVRAVLHTPVTRIYTLVRGGKERLWSRLTELLPLDMVQKMEASDKIVPVEGDITKPGFGLDVDLRDTIRKEVTVIVHGASTLHLRHKLDKIAKNVIFPSLEMGKFALECQHLSRFVYVSTAYTNAFLHFNRLGKPTRRMEQDCVIAERIYPLWENGNNNANAELANIVEFGTTPEHSHMGHPFAYSYAKHLTERLLTQMYTKAGREDNLLLFRPSCFGPAERLPYPGFETEGSVPVTTVMSAVFGSPPICLSVTSNLPDPSLANIDEVPLDVVVDRLVAHIAFGTSGIVHAVSGKRGRRSSAKMFETAGKMRSFWWSHPKLKWCGPDADPSKVCFISKTFGVLGCSFFFLDDQTQRIWDDMQPDDRKKWHLWREIEADDLSDFKQRSYMARSILRTWMKKRHGLPGWATSLLTKKPRCVRPGSEEQQAEMIQMYMEK